MTDTLARVIATVESGPFPYAMRFEANMYGRGSPFFTTSILEAAERANQCNAITGRMICSTSWGLFQIMGFNLFNPEGIGLTIAIGPYLFDSEQQFNAFKRFVKINGFDADNFDFGDDGLIERFARSYNGPGDVANYSAKMKAAFASLPKEAA